MKDTNFAMLSYLSIAAHNKIKEICKGEGKITSAKPYSNAEIITFENGNKYRMEIRKWTPETITLD